MFKKQPLYQAKKDTLMGSIDLINAQSKAMNEVLQYMEGLIQKINDENQLMVSVARNKDTREIETKNFSRTFAITSACY